MPVGKCCSVKETGDHTEDLKGEQMSSDDLLLKNDMARMREGQKAVR